MWSGSGLCGMEQTAGVSLRNNQRSPARAGGAPWGGRRRKPWKRRKNRRAVGKVGARDGDRPRHSPRGAGFGSVTLSAAGHVAPMLLASPSELPLQGDGCSYSANVDSCSLYILKDNISLNKINHYIFFYSFQNTFTVSSKISSLCIVSTERPALRPPPSPSPSPRPLSCPGFLLPSSPRSAFPPRPAGRPRRLPFWEHFAQTALFWGTGAGAEPRRCQLGCSLGSRPFCFPVLRRQVVRKPMGEAVYSESCGLLFFF